MKQHTGLAMTLKKLGAPTGPGGSSLCKLQGSEPFQTLFVQLWKGGSAAMHWQPAMNKGTEFTGKGYRAFIAYKAQANSGRTLYSATTGLLKGDVYLSLILDARDQSVSDAKLRTLMDQMTPQF